MKIDLVDWYKMSFLFLLRKREWF